MPDFEFLRILLTEKFKTDPRLHIDQNMEQSMLHFTEIISLFQNLQPQFQRINIGSVPLV